MRLRYSKGHRRVANSAQSIASSSPLKSGNHSDDALFSAFDPDSLPTHGNIQIKGWGLPLWDIHTVETFRWVF
jgi:hypothetical protein